METVLLVASVFGTGVAVGWIGCQLLVVLGLTNQIITMRAAGFDPLPKRPNKEPEPSLEVNET